MDNGIYTGEIVRHDLRTKSGKDYIYFAVNVDDGYGKVEEWPVKVWLTTDGAIKRARVTLRRLGFDIDTPDGISPLLDDPHHLAGTLVEVEITDNPPYGQQCNIVLDDDKPMESSKTASISAKLKSFAMDNEKPLAAPSRTNSGQAKQKAKSPKPDPWDKANVKEAAKKAQDESDSIPF